jgi:Na+-transporting methylmalonyl-CoA/oxaloacetate decarboxylase beta subunit
MQLVSRKNFLIFLAAILVVAFGYMALTLSRPSKTQKALTEAEREIQQIQKQSNSDELEEIEKDLNNTDFIDIDKELQDIENELEATY